MLPLPTFYWPKKVTWPSPISIVCENIIHRKLKNFMAKNGMHHFILGERKELGSIILITAGRIGFLTSLRTTDFTDR